jgi:hypothetical protein
MLTGQVPFDAESLMGILQHHFFSPVPDIAGVRGDVPPELLQVVHRALAKEAADRFPTTREMVRAIEGVPFSDADRAVAEDTLRHLAVGSAVPKVRTGSLPPLADTRTLGRPRPTAPQGGPDTTAPTIKVGAPGPARRPPPRRRSPLPIVLAAAVVVAAGGTGVLLVRRQAAARQAAADSVAAQQRRADSVAAERRRADSAAAVLASRPDTTPPAAAGGDGQRRPAERPARSAAQPRQGAQAPATASDPAPAGSGMLRVSVSPPNAQIAVDGRVLGTGALFDEELRAGTHRLRISAPGYVTRELTFTITPAGTNNLGRINLEPQP